MASSGKPIYSPRFAVTVGGTTYREPGGRIADLVVETTVDGADRFSFTLNYPFDPEHGDFSGLSWDDFAVGTEVEIELGWGGSGSLEPVFLGDVRAIRADFSPDRGPVAGISGYGKLHELMRGTAANSWTEATLEDVVTEVLSEYFDGGNIEVEDADLTQEKVIQQNESDYRFLQNLADRYGFRLYAERDTVSFEPRSAMGGDSVATLRYGEALDSFNAEINASSAVGTVEVRDYDMSEESEIVGTATSDGDASGKRVFRLPVRSSEEADRIAQNKLSRLSSPTASGNGEAEGVPSLVAGTTVTLEDLGERFSHNYYVTQASHRMGGSGYRTSFEAKEIPE